MAERTPRAAYSAFLERIRQTAQCVVHGTVIGSGYEIDVANSVTLVPYGQGAGDAARLRMQNGRGELRLRVAHQYMVVHHRDDSGRVPYQIGTSSYSYGILDHNEDEVLVFHWEPHGIGPVQSPHLHVSGVPVMRLPRRPEPHEMPMDLFLGKMHVPTGHILLEDVVELLIREFAVAPHRADWQAVLTENRAASRHGQPW